MRLYHGSNQQILEIDLKKSKDHKDFGRGFYKRYGDDFRNPEHLSELAPQLRFPGTEYIQYCFCTSKGVKQLKLDL